jgi:hypothetical protein
VRRPGAHITVYAGPPPPSGTVHWMYSLGILMLQHLQCTQFCALMTRQRFPLESASEYSYTPAGQNLCSGPAYSVIESSGGMMMEGGREGQGLRERVERRVRGMKGR